MSPRLTRRQFLPAALAPLAALTGCRTCPSIFGYRVGGEALYDTNISSVYVPMFANRAFQTTPYRGMEAEITTAIVREIGAKTPFKVISNPDCADTELKGYIVSIDKLLLNRNQQNTIRQGEIAITVNVIWLDLRDGTVLSAPRRGFNPATGVPAQQPIAPPVPFDPDVPQPPPVQEIQIEAGTTIVAVGRLIPELGETNASGQKMAVDQLAIQIVSMMEKRW
jgi:hypothetical protein